MHTASHTCARSRSHPILFAGVLVVIQISLDPLSRAGLAMGFRLTAIMLVATTHRLSWSEEQVMRSQSGCSCPSRVSYLS